MTEHAVLLTGDRAHGEAGENRWANATPEERAATFARHDRFTVALGERGHTVTGGAELEHSRGAKVVRGTSGAVSVTDGPYAWGHLPLAGEAAEQLGGFYLVSSDNLAGRQGTVRLRRPGPAPGARGRMRKALQARL